MDSQHLQDRLTEIQGHIDDFKRKQVDSEANYQKTLELLTDPELKSSFMEEHVIHTNRHKSAIARMEKLHREVQDQLASMQQSNL